ncbi:MAG: transglycosylase SLT domain-containing protein [Actinobacteria bacterium]|nr:transglycosylase SLT domain-containing protein [Actinomycetota bacterium]
MHRPDARAPREGGVRARLTVVLTVALTVGSLAVPALADVSQSDIRAAESAVAEASALVREARDDLAAAERRLERLVESLAAVEEDLATRADDIEETRAEARNRIARMYMSAGASGGPSLPVANLGSMPAQVAYLAALADQDREVVNQLAASRADLVRFRGIVEESIAEQQIAVSDAAAAVDDRLADLEAVQSDLSAVQAQWQREEQARREAEAARIAAEEAERRRQAALAQQQKEEEERRNSEQEQRRQEALAAMQAAAAAASAAGWTPGAGVEPWRGLVAQYFPAAMVDDALSVMACESLGDPLAINKYSAASGLFQHLPYYWPSRSTKAGWGGADIFDPEANIAVAAWLVNRTITVEGRDAWAHWTCKP